MNWKIFTIAFINVMAILMPYNIIGCSDDGIDPHDYFISFFDKGLVAEPSLNAFYYTNYQFLYDTEEAVDASELTSEEWITYAGRQVTKKEAHDFVCNFSVPNLASLYQHIEKNEALMLPDSVQKNALTKYFMESGDREALGYLLYTRKLEPFVTGSWSSWEPLERDSLAMAKLIHNGQQLFAASKKDFIKMRYAYQIIRLAHYSKRYHDCINWYDQLVKPLSVPGIIQELCISLKAGALLQTGKKNEAAYEFSKLFSRNKYKRISNYMSFDWSVKRFDAKSRAICVALCKNDAEKADMLGLFALGSNENELKTIEQIFSLNPGSKLLEMLTVREMHKMEDFYFTPALSSPHDQDISLTDHRSTDAENKRFQFYKTETKELLKLCKFIAASGKVSDSAFFLITAAHAAMIDKDYPEAGKILNSINKKNLSTVLNDQWNLTNILITINAKDSITTAFEQQMMPSVKWLSAKAIVNPEYTKFYRRLFANILAPRYRQLKGAARVKYLLCEGVADSVSKMSDQQSWGYYPSAIADLRKNLRAEEVDELIEVIENKKSSAFDKFLISNSAFSKDDLNDIAGTCWLRKFDFPAAEKRFAKVSRNYYSAEPFITFLAANPFADLLLDTHAPTTQDTVVYTKLRFTRKMMSLEKQVETAVADDVKAGAYYELAKGYYHMSYWGNSWLLMQYDWSGNTYLAEDIIKARSNDECYTVKRSKDYYLKAYNTYTDENKKARALYMAAKCDQKQMGDMPNTYSAGTIKEYNAVLKKWLIAFDNRNKYFTTLNKEYSNTTFYKEAVRSCSFLNDFVRSDKR